MTAVATPELQDPLLRRSPAMAVLTQGLPLALGLASHAAINLVDLAMVGRLGQDAVRAAHVGSTWNFLPMIVGNCISTALLSRLSRRLGDNDIAGARAFNVRAQWFMVWLGIVVSLLTAWPASSMVDQTGLTGAVRDDAVHYLMVSNLGCLPMFVLMQTTAAMRAAGEAMVPLLLLLFANALNLLLGAVLLFGWQAIGVSSVGVVGASYAAVIARTLAAAFAVWWLWRRQHLLTLRRPAASHAIACGPVVRPLLIDAWPQIVQIGLRAAIVLLVTTCVVKNFGDGATASLGITTRLDTLVLFSALGFANAATAYSGRAVMHGWSGRARAAGLWAAGQAGLLGAFFVLVMTAIAPLLVDWFVPTRSQDVVKITQLYFSTAAWGQVFGAVALGAMGAVQGAGHMVQPLVVDVIGFAIAFVLVEHAAADGQPLAAIYRALVVGMGIVALLQVGLVMLGRWTSCQAGSGPPV